MCVSVFACAAGLHDVAFYTGMALMDLINILMRPLVFEGVLAWVVSSASATPL
jgi:hypothetical protein